MGLAYFLFATYGMTLIITQSILMKPLRDWFEFRVPFIHTLLNCPMCTSFWVALGAIFLLGFSPAMNYFGFLPHPDLYNIPHYVFDASLVAGFNWYLYLLQLNLEKDVADEL